MLLTAVDKKYLFAEAQFLIKSCAKFEPKQRFYLYLVNTEKYWDKEIKKWHQNIIIEHAEFSYDPEKWRGLMCSARSMPLESVLTSYKEPTIYLDSDILLREPLTELFEQLKDNDVLIRLRSELKLKGPAGTEHSSKFNSGVIAVSPTEQAIKFVKEYNGRMHNHIASGEPAILNLGNVCTYIDQEYLYLVYLDMKDNLKFRPLDIKFNDPYFNDKSVVWHGKGVARTALKYKREKSRYESKLKFIKYSIHYYTSPQTIYHTLNSIPNNFFFQTLKKGVRKRGKNMKLLHYTDLFNPERYLKEFKSYINEVEYTDRTPLNTEMFYMWCMIRTLKPEIFIESGTFKGYSASIICEALSRNDNNPKFITIGFNLDNCIPYATKRLSKYKFAKVIEGDSREYLKNFKIINKRAAFFVDGPKGSNMYPLFKIILKKFPDFQFIGVHDCNKENGSGNRYCINNFFGREFPILYSDIPFQEKYSHLDKPLINASTVKQWRPYHFNDEPIESYGTETGYIIGLYKEDVNDLEKFYYGVSRYWRISLKSKLATVLYKYIKK